MKSAPHLSSLAASVLVPICLLGVAAVPALAGGAALAPHQAVYEITLERASTSSGITDMSGRMVYELVGGACTGYTQSMRFVTRVTDRTGASMINDLRTRSWEAVSGDKMRFLLNQYRGKQLTETTEGYAGRKLRTGEINVELTKPTNRAINLDPEVYFPIQHSIALLKAAREGKRQFPARLYDGSEQGETVFETNSFIGNALPESSALQGVPEKLRKAGGLEGKPAWPVAISYYEPGSRGTDAAPSYELAFRFHESGISSKLLIDYGDFAIRGKLTGLKLLDAETCEADK
ncbi:MAG: cell envelope integrity EipB family protein [Alphaproteobacteria bacterium]|nr:cell envelope integrity EipB family protein [Alphaproteobacteria bacterium]